LAKARPKARRGVDRHQREAPSLIRHFSRRRERELIVPPSSRPRPRASPTSAAPRVRPGLQFAEARTRNTTFRRKGNNMRKFLEVVALGVGLLAFTGCAGSADQANEQEPVGEIEGALARVKLPDGELVFIKTDDSVIVIENASIDLRGPLDRLLERQMLTVLELFKAVAPEREVPAEILRAHASQAASLGRVDVNAVLEVAFEREPGSLRTLDLVSESKACQDYVYPGPSQSYTVQNKDSAVYSSVGIPFDFGPAFGFQATYPVTLGVCNRGPSSIETRYRYDMTGDTASWLSSPWLAMGANIRRRYYPVQHQIASNPTKYAISYRGPGGASANATGFLALATIVPTIR
jgi:hypothetical protein